MHGPRRPGYFAPKPARSDRRSSSRPPDPTGRISTVAAEDLEVVEDGVPQRVERFHEASQPMSIVLALDASGSMRTARRTSSRAPTRSRRTAAGRRARHPAVLRCHDARARPVHGPGRRRAPPSRPTRPAVARRCSTPSPMRSRGCETAEGRRVVVVMTDGRDENNPGTAPAARRSLDDVLRAVKESGATVFIDWARHQGGCAGAAAVRRAVRRPRRCCPQDVSQLPAEFQRVIEDLGRRYVIGYTSTNPEHDGQWRNVEIRVTGAPDVSVRSVGGYTRPDANAEATRTRGAEQMRTSGGRGLEGWIMAIPLIALLVAASLTSGGVDGLLYGVDGAVRQIVAAVVGFVRDVF